MTDGADQERAPIAEALVEYARSGVYPFHTPGHKFGRFADGDLESLVGREGLALDLPALTATDNTFHPHGCVRDAQRLAADLFGAGETFYLSAGSTLGIATAMLATVPPGETVVLPRNVHRSVIAGLILSGARPRFVAHDVHPEYGGLGVAADRLAEALETEPRPAAVLVTRPTYYGLAGDLASLAETCHARQVPLVVDEAHGAHFAFLPSGSPETAMAAGADLAVQSCHKTLGSLVGSAQLHVGRKSLVEPERVREALNFLQTTSPSFLLLASLDLVRRRMAREGETLFSTAVADAETLERELDALPGISVMRTEKDSRLAGHRRDPLRLIVSVRGTGWTGYEVEIFLRKEYQVEDEMSDWSNVVYVLSPQDDEAARQRLLAGLKAVSQSPREARHLEEVADARFHQPAETPLAMLPRDAALAAKKSVALSAAAGRICAEMVMFYPPGIPLLIPGELVTIETIEICRKLMAAGADPYANDPSLATVRVVHTD